MSETYESHRWVKRKGEPARRIKVEYDRSRLLLTSVRVGNLAADLLDGVDDWRRQTDAIRRERRRQLGPGHPMRAEQVTDDAWVLHALLNEGEAITLCGSDSSDMDGHVIPGPGGDPHHALMFEDSNPRSQCKKCRTASGL